MKIIDIISLTLRNLFRRKVRTILTVTGVVVGTCSIVVMISLGVGMDKSLQDKLEMMGDLTIIDVYGYNPAPDKPKLNDETIKKISQIDGVVVASPFWQPYEISMEVKAGKKDRYSIDRCNFTGVYPKALDAFGYKLSEGKSLPDNPSKKEIDIVIGSDMDYRFKDTKKKTNNRVWKDVKPDGSVQKPFVNMTKDDLKLVLSKQMEEDKKPKPGDIITYDINVTGRMEQDWKRGYETSNGIFMDIDVLKKLEKEYNKLNGIKKSKQDSETYDNAKVKVKDISLVEPVEEAIKAMGLETSSMDEIRKPMEEQKNQQQLMLGGLGGISLFVAAIGITNTMVMSIYERTKEIGVMKVLGCKTSNIRSTFLFEAGLIGLFGGILGVGISFGISHLMNSMQINPMGDGGMPMWMMGGGEEAAMQISIIPPWLVILAIAFATLIGLISGFYPANRAVKISAMEAIKHD